MGSGAADIAEIVSDIKTKLPDLDAPPQLDSPEQARFRLFDSITAFLKTASQRKPIMLVLDDLHWSDTPSLMLLQFITREFASSRILLVGAYRDVELNRQHPLAETLGELTRERLFERVLLRGLSEQDVSRFIEVTSGIAPPATLVSAVHTQTEGNPLFVTEVVRLLVQEGELTQERLRDRDSWEIRIPDGVREVIGRRLNRLSQRCNETLSIASVIGREFESDQLVPLIDDVSDDRLLETLEEALQARVIEELPNTVGRYQFTHALIQDTLQEELSTTRRARLHARIGEAFEVLYGDNVENYAAELAYHFSESVMVTGRGKLVLYSQMAGERALTGYAYEEALSHFERALAAREDQETNEETAALLFGLGRAQSALVQISDAIDNFGRAFDYYSKTKNVDMVVEIAASPLPAYVSALAGFERIVSGALALVPPDSIEEARLRANHGSILGLQQADLKGARQSFDRAISIARRENDLELEMTTLANSGLVELYHLQWDEAIKDSLSAIKLAERISSPAAEAAAHYTIAIKLWFQGETSEIQKHVDAGLAAAEITRDRSLLARTLWSREFVPYYNGDWKTVRTYSDRTQATLPTDARGLFTRTLMEFETGEFEQGDSYLQKLLDIMLNSPSAPNIEHAVPATTIAITGRITGNQEHFELAHEIVTQFVSSPALTPLAAHLGYISLGLIEVQRANAQGALPTYEELKRLGKSTPAFCIVVDRVLGLLAHTMGNLEDAQGHFEDALAFCRKAGYRPELAWSLCDYADMLLERKGDGDKEMAVAMLDESLAISTELGMRPLLERVLSRREILKA
ncbi:MAG: tetratricopeptide repeat protein, partial [Chloroflexi bacterium]|nr:tetratricopeptide repeat protein [Chloroflexota bacterium]